MDRTDTSQYETENSGVIFNGSLTGTDAQVASAPVVFAHGEQMLDYIDPTVIPPTIPDGLSTKTQRDKPDWNVYRPIAPGISAAIIGSKIDVIGWEFHNLNATAAQVNLHDGYDANGTAVFHIVVPASGSVQLFIPNIRFNTGVYVNAVVGQVEGNLFVRAV